jgi:hypothetical protein
MLDHARMDVTDGIYGYTTPKCTGKQSGHSNEMPLCFCLVSNGKIMDVLNHRVEWCLAVSRLSLIVRL